MRHPAKGRRSVEVAEEAAGVVERRSSAFLRGDHEAGDAEIRVLLREVEVER